MFTISLSSLVDPYNNKERMQHYEDDLFAAIREAASVRHESDDDNDTDEENEDDFFDEDDEDDLDLDIPDDDDM